MGTIESLKQLAALPGSINEYPFEPSEELAKHCKEKGFVILFGGSDDLMELRGAIYDEVGCNEGGDCFVDSKGMMPDITDLMDEGDQDGCRDYFTREPGFKKITAVWNDDDPDDYSWTYETDIPHETFEIMDGGEKYCKGIIFDLNNLS